MRRPLLVATLLCSAAAARAGTPGADLEPITETARSPKLDRLRQLDAELAQAMAATPTAAQIRDERAVTAAADRIRTLLADVKQALVPGLRPSFGTTYGVVQDNVRIVEARLELVTALRAATVALTKLAAVAKVHGEPDPALVKEVAAALDRLDAYKSSAPELHRAVLAWNGELERTLDEVSWPAAAPTIELSRHALAQAPIAAHGTVDGHRFQPFALLQVDAPLSGVAMYGNRVAVRIRGPVEHQGDLVVGPRDGAGRELAPGTYVLEAQGYGGPTPVDVLITDQDTPLDPMQPLGAIAATDPVSVRRLETVYPFLHEVAPAYQRQQLFLTAPRALFVYARDDFGPHDADSQQSLDARPRKDEPLLVYAGPNHNGYTLFDAEGLSWTVRDLSLVAAAPSGAPALPDHIHDVNLSFERVDFHDTHAAPEFGTLPPGVATETIKEYTAVTDAWTKCVDKVVEKHGGARINDYDVITYRNGHVAKVESLSEQVFREADRVCGANAFEAKMKKLTAALSAAHAKARADALAQIRAAWAK
jgi:hypothetical protein